MELLHAIILGLVQGLTEFLPISSSGHLVLVGELLGVADPGSLFVIAVHVGTLFSVLIYFRRQLWELLRGMFQPLVSAEHRMLFYIVIGTLPAVILGLSFKDFFKGALKNEVLAAAMLCVTGAMLLLPGLLQKIRGPRKGEDVNWRSALFMGLGQAFAILPGISRSGSTITVGMLAGTNPARAAEFSFLLAIPVIAGGALFEFGDLGTIPAGEVTPCLVGAAIAFVSGLFAIYAVLDSIRRGKFQYFAYYCLAVGAAALFYFGVAKG